MLKVWSVCCRSATGLGLVCGTEYIGIGSNLITCLFMYGMLGFFSRTKIIYFPHLQLSPKSPNSHDQITPCQNNIYFVQKCIMTPKFHPVSKPQTGLVSTSTATRCHTMNPCYLSIYQVPFFPYSGLDRSKLVHPLFLTTMSPLPPGSTVSQESRLLPDSVLTFTYRTHHHPAGPPSRRPSRSASQPDPGCRW